MIVNIRGANGSGKSTVVREFMALGCRVPLYGVLGSRRPEAYSVHLDEIAATVFVLGPYDIPTGGCDSLRSAQIVALLEKYVQRGHVLFEGALVSDHWGEVGAFLDTHVSETVLMFMPASLEECLRRIGVRRNDRREGAPALVPERTARRFRDVDPRNTKKRYGAIARTTRNFVGERFRVLTLSDDRGAQEVLEVFRGA